MVGFDYKVMVLVAVTTINGVSIFVSLLGIFDEQSEVAILGRLSVIGILPSFLDSFPLNRTFA